MAGQYNELDQKEGGEDGEDGMERPS